MAAVELEAVGLADPVDHLHLQRDDGHRRQRLRQQLERAVEDRVVEDHLVELGGVGRHCRHDRAVERRTGERHAGHGVRLPREGLRRARVEAERLREPLQELAFRRRRGAVGIADAHRHLVGELPLVRRARSPRRPPPGPACEEHVLIDRGRVERAVAAQRVGDPLDLRALALGIARRRRRRPSGRGSGWRVARSCSWQHSGDRRFGDEYGVRRHVFPASSHRILRPWVRVCTRGSAGSAPSFRFQSQRDWVAAARWTT